MPPQITFIKLNDKLSLPVKVFVNRNVTSSTSDISINAKSLIKLNNNFFQIKLSNNYLKTLFNETLSDKLIETLLNKPTKEIFTNSTTSIIRTLVSLDSVKYNLIIPQSLLITIRAHLNLLTHSDISHLNSITPNFMDKLLIADFQLNLLINQNQMIKLEPTLLVEDDDDMFVDEKKLVDVKLKRLNLLNNLQNCIKLYIVK